MTSISQADSVKGDAISSKARSSSVGDEANALRAEVEEVVKVSVRGVKMRHSELKDLRRRIEGRIDVVKDDIVTFERVGKCNYYSTRFKILSCLLYIVQ